VKIISDGLTFELTRAEASDLYNELELLRRSALDFPGGSSSMLRKIFDALHVHGVDGTQ
jgi:hypothetical protein